MKIGLRFLPTTYLLSGHMIYWYSYNLQVNHVEKSDMIWLAKDKAHYGNNPNVKKLVLRPCTQVDNCNINNVQIMFIYLYYTIGTSITTADDQAHSNP